MGFQLVWKNQEVKKTDARVTVERQGVFGPRAGTVQVIGHSPCQIRVISPNWKMNSEQLLEMLPRCYREILQRTMENGCSSVSLPLLTAREPGFPRYWDYSLAFDTIRAFTAEHEIDVYLVLDRADPPSDQEIQADLDRFLARFVLDIDKSMGWYEPPRSELRIQIEKSLLGEEDPDDQAADDGKLIPAFPCRSSENLDEADDDLPVFLFDSENGEEISLSGRAQEQSEEDERFPIPRFPDVPEFDDDDDILGWEVSELEPPPPPNIIGDASEKIMVLPDPCGLPEVKPGKIPTTEELTEFLRYADAGFTESLLRCIDATGKKDSEIYTKANITRQLFSKIRNDPNYKPTKQTAVALAVALELDLEQTKDLIGRAGYTLNNSNKFDLIITFFIQRKYYNVVDINIALLHFDQKLLGSEVSSAS